MNKTLQAIDIKQHILWIRNEKVMLDSDLASLYGVETKILLQAVKRNMDRDFQRILCFSWINKNLKT